MDLLILLVQIASKSTYYFLKPFKTAHDARIKREALTFRAVHHKHTAKAARLERHLHMVSKNLLKLGYAWYQNGCGNWSL